MSHYPSWRYHRNGKAFLVQNPDLEPQGPDWAESPWPPLPVEPKLNPCCAELKAKFDAAWEKREKELDAQWQEKVDECATLQAQLERYAPATEIHSKPKKK